MGTTARPARRVPTDPRFSRRRKALARARRRRLGIAAGTVVGVAALAWAILWSPLLRVHHVEVVGARRTGAAAVVSATGLGGEDHLLSFAGADVIARVEELPWVRDARLERVLPGTVRVLVEERRPALALTIEGDRWLVDAQGRVLAPGGEGGALPILAGIEPGTIAPGDRLRVAAATHALTMWRALPGGVKEDVRAIVAPSVERVTLVLDDGTHVRYGAAERMRAKNAVLVAVRRRLADTGRRVAYIDVRIPHAPAVGSPPVDPAPTTSPTAPPSSPTPEPTPTDP